MPPESLGMLVTNGDLVSSLWTGMGLGAIDFLPHGPVTALSQPSSCEHGQITFLLSICSMLVTTVPFAQLSRVARYLFPPHIQCLIAGASLGGD